MTSHLKSPAIGASVATRIIAGLIALILLAIGGYFIYGGIELLSIGGSPYYIVAGIILLITAALLVMLRIQAAYLYAAFFVATALWSFWEVGFRFWPLAARLGMFAVGGLLIALVVPCFPRARAVAGFRKLSYATAALTAAGLVAAFASAFFPIWIVKPGHTPEVAVDYDASSEPDSWVGFGRTASGEQFAPYDQITRENVGNLEVAWTFRSGDITGNGRENQNTPLQIGNTLYACTPTNEVFALRADTGEQIWHFDPEVTGQDTANWSRCRSLAYYDVPGLADDAVGKKRVYLSTGNMRLIALDANTGTPVRVLVTTAQSCWLRAWARSHRASTTLPRAHCLPAAI